jgi:hypothetical protein
MNARTWLGSGLLLAVGALFTSVACGPRTSDSYCDSTGCYDCDGYGCAPRKPNVTPPPSCGAKGCASVCSTDAQCRVTEACISGACAVKPVVTAPECKVASECGVGRTCTAGTCGTCGGGSANGPCPCAKDAECKTGNVCQAGACTPKANVCQFASECAEGDQCSNGQCVSACAGTTCAAGSTCVKGGCIPDAVGATCNDNSQCAAPSPQCVGGRCAAACSDDASCGAGNYCNEGACITDTRPKTNCATDAQCSGAGQTCKAGYCKYTCLTDAACRQIDSRIGWCGADKVCRTSLEASPECLRKSDCSAGKDCVNNACK